MATANRSCIPRLLQYVVMFTASPVNPEIILLLLMYQYAGRNFENAITLSASIQRGTNTPHKKLVPRLNIFDTRPNDADPKLNEPISNVIVIITIVYTKLFSIQSSPLVDNAWTGP